MRLTGRLERAEVESLVFRKDGVIAVPLQFREVNYIGLLFLQPGVCIARRQHALRHFDCSLRVWQRNESNTKSAKVGCPVFDRGLIRTLTWKVQYRYIVAR